MARSLKDVPDTDPAQAIRDAVDARSGKSESELLSELSELTRQERAAGRMNDLYMEDIYEKLSPMLTDAQREKMREVLRRLKE